MAIQKQSPNPQNEEKGVDSDLDKLKAKPLEVAKVVQNIVKGTPYVDLSLFKLTSKIEKIEKLGPASFEFPD